MINSQKCHHIFAISGSTVLDLEKGHLFLGSVGSTNSAIIKGNRIGALVTVLDEQ
jgi:hypothetical protein